MAFVFSDARRNNVCQSPTLTVNHAYLCLDIKDCNITPTIIDFPTNALEDIHDKHLLTKYSCGCAQYVHNEAFAMNKPSTANARKRKTTHPLLIARTEELSSSENMIRQFTLAINNKNSRSKSSCTEDVPHTGVSQSPVLTLNHAYFCLDIKDCNIKPAIICFHNIAREDIRDIHLSTERSRSHTQHFLPELMIKLKVLNIRFDMLTTFAMNSNVPRTGVSQSLVLTLNHAYFCLDIEGCNIKPAIIGFLNIAREDIRDIHLSAERSCSHTQHVHTEAFAMNTTSNLNARKRKTPHPLSIPSAEEPSSSGNMIWRFIVGVNNRSLRSKSSQAQGDTSSYIDLGNCDQGLIHVLDEHNGLVRLFRTARDRYIAGKIPRFKIRLYNMGGVRGYELPTSDTLGGIVFESGPRSRTDFDVIIEFKGEPPQRINKLHQSYMSLQFPLLFVFGEPGFYPDLMLKPQNGRGKGKKVTMNAYYKYQLHPRVKEFGLIFRSGRLFQQYVVAVYYAIKMNHLDYIRKNQNYLLSDYLSGLYDVASRGDHEGIAAGLKIFGIKRLLDDLEVIYKSYNCSKIKTAERVSTVKREWIKTDQKRGLPHCHTLLWVDSKSELQDAQYINELISAKIPDPVKDPHGYKLVTELMMHRPCGSANSSASCTEGGVCNKHFPKNTMTRCFFDNNGHTQYQRRDTGVSVMKGESRLDNCNVVPYNRTLCLAFEAHINVEYCGWSMLIKYLFKYISKGPDRILAKISNSKASTLVPRNNKPVDEIQNYVDGQFICPFEACWRIFDFPIHSRELVVQILSVYLENMQRVNFRARDRLDIIVNLPEKKKTTLTEWFVYNNENTDGDLFYFRMLLCHQKGCKSSADVRTVNGLIHPNNRAACEALGLLGDDKEWDIALQESTASAASNEVKILFAQIHIYYDVSDPIKPWIKHLESMSEDIPAKISKATRIPNDHVNTAELKGREELQTNYGVIGDLDNSTSNVLIPLDSWISGILVYKLPLSEPAAVEPEKSVGSNEVLTNDQPQTTSEPVVQPSNEVQTPPVHFPRRLRKEKEKALQKKFLENLKQLHINLPFIEELTQMPKCSVVLLNKLPSKEKDPWSFTIPCDIGQLHIDNALADLGANISLIPYTMYKKLGLGESKATRISLELEGGSI
ncbi:hypothetical protein Tco_0591445 [Tanacetum coccineum]